MVATNISKDPGLALWESEEFSEAGLISGEDPKFGTKEHFTLLDQNADLPAYTPVGIITASGKVTISDMAAVDGSAIAIGITGYKVPDPGADLKIAVVRSGCFNPDKLNWHASYNTAAKKTAAFRGAPTPTNIVIRSIG